MAMFGILNHIISATVHVSTFHKNKLGRFQIYRAFISLLPARHIDKIKSPVLQKKQQINKLNVFRVNSIVNKTASMEALASKVFVVDCKSDGFYSGSFLQKQVMVKNCELFPLKSFIISEMRFYILANKVTAPIAENEKWEFSEKWKFPNSSHTFRILDNQNTPDRLLLAVLSVGSFISPIILIMIVQDYRS